MSRLHVYAGPPADAFTKADFLCRAAVSTSAAPHLPLQVSKKPMRLRDWLAMPFLIFFVIGALLLTFSPFI